MNINKAVNHLSVGKQWETLKQMIIRCGAEVELLTPQPGWPDLVFTANAGLFYQHRIFLSHFKFKERQGEEVFFADWFIKKNYEVVYPDKDPDEFFEGAGDALLLNDKLFAAFGFRSDRKFYEGKKFFDLDKLIFCELVDPYFYHLDTCFCPLNQDLAIWYPQAFSHASQKKMATEAELIAVPEAEAKQFACNAVVIHNNIILPKNCPQLTLQLKRRGFAVHGCEMSEFLKSGGACKCLTLRID